MHSQQINEKFSQAHSIWQREKRQAAEIRAGKKLREQFQFEAYLSQRSVDDEYTFRQHLRAMGEAIEE